MPQRALLLAGATLALTTTRAWAVKEWYDLYHEARAVCQEEGRRPRDYDEALKSLREAQRLKPNPALNEQTYGLQFVNYFPYYYQGLCYLRLGDLSSAQRYFNIEEDHGAIRKNDAAYRELKRFRAKAEDVQWQEVTRSAKAELDRLLKQSTEQAKAKKFEEALASLAQAQKLSSVIDPQTRLLINERIKQIRSEEAALAEATARAQRMEQALADGRRLLEEGKADQAGVRFDEALTLDPGNARAREGRREAQERIRASRNRQELETAFAEGRALFDAGQYEQAIRPLTVAAADPANASARDYLERAQRFMEGLRQQKDLHLKIERLLSEGDRLLARRQFPEAQVKFESVLQLDPTHVRAKERSSFAERRTGEVLLEQWLPNQKPVLNILEPKLVEKSKSVEIEGPRVAVVGVATDDRSIASVEFRIGGRIVAQLAPPMGPDTGESQRNLPFDRTFDLKPGLNEITVIATDAMGLKREVALPIIRRLRFYETRAFLPSALGAALGLVGVGFAIQRVRRNRAVRNRFNPYIAGAPVLDDEMFFGRRKLMARILNVLHHNSLMITGERRIGKTTFLYHLKKVLEADDGTEYRFFPVFTDLQGVPEAGFFHALMTDVVETLRPGPATLAPLRFRPDAEAYDGRDFSHDLQRVIEELKTRTNKRVKLALLIDEVDVLNEYSERVNQRLRSIFMKTFAEHLVAVMSGVGIKRTWKSEVSPWYNFFDEIELTALSREEAEALIRTPVEGIFRFDAEAVEGILSHSRLKPYLIQKFCIHAVNRILEERRNVVTAMDVEVVRETVQLEARDEETHLSPLGQEASA